MQKLSLSSLYPHTFSPIEHQTGLQKSRHQCNAGRVWAALDITKLGQSPWISHHNFDIIRFHRAVPENSTGTAGTIPTEKGQGMWIPVPASSGRLEAGEGPGQDPTVAGRRLPGPRGPSGEAAPSERMSATPRQECK